MNFTKQKGYNTHQVQLIYVTSFCLISSTFAVGLRLLARRQFGIKLWWDDYIAVIALVCNIPYFYLTESQRPVRYFHIFQAFLLFSVYSSRSNLSLASDLNGTIGLGAGLGLHSSELSIDGLQFVAKVDAAMIYIMYLVDLLMAWCCF